MDGDRSMSLRSKFQSSIDLKADRYCWVILYEHQSPQVPILDRPEGQSLPERWHLGVDRGKCSNPRSPRRAIATFGLPVGRRAASAFQSSIAPKGNRYARFGVGTQ